MDRLNKINSPEFVKTEKLNKRERQMHLEFATFQLLNIDESSQVLTIAKFIAHLDGASFSFTFWKRLC